MVAIIDLANEFHNQHDEVLFGRIATDLHTKGFSANLNALPLKLANQLYLHVSAMTDASFEDAAIGRGQDHKHQMLERSQMQSWISSGDSEASSSWLIWAGELQNYLNKHLFLGLSSFESHYAHYRLGDFYKRHYDSFKGQAGRKLSIIVYLNRDWLVGEGGELVLYKEDEDKIGLTVTPNFATVVVFLSEEHPHEVLRAHRDRYSIAGWYSPNPSALLQ